MKNGDVYWFICERRELRTFRRSSEGASSGPGDKGEEDEKGIILQRAGPRLTYLEGRDCISRFFGFWSYMTLPVPQTT